MGSQLKKLKNKNGEKVEYSRGYRAGREDGIRQTLDYFTERLATLNEVEGIGTKLYERITEHIESGFKSKSK